MRSAGRESGPRRSPRWRRAVVPLCEASGGASARRGDPHQLRGDDDRDPRRQQQHHHPRDLHPSHPVRRGPASGSGSAMKGKERSPVKPKRSRGGGEDSSSSRGERSKKLGGSGGSNGSSSGGGKSGESSRRSLHLDKSRSSSRGGSREYDTGSSRSLHAYSSPSTAKNSSGGGGGESRSSSRGRGGGGGESRSSGAAGSSSASSALDGGGGGGGEYKTLKISELGSQLSDEAVEDGLFHEFKRFGDVSVKISHLAGSGSGPGGDEQRVAFVNFRRAEDARAAKHARGRLVLYDRPLKIEAVYASRRRSRSPLDKDAYGLSSSLAGMSVSGHRHAPGGGGGGGQRSLSPGGAALGYRDYRLQQLALGRLPPPPPPPLPRELDRDRDYQFYDRVRPAYSLEPRVGAGGGGSAAPFRDVDEIAPEDDQRANRTLFLGNLDITVTESDLRRAFDRFGVITEVDIKRPSRGQTSTYGFLKFENLDMSHRAKLAMSGKIIVRNPIKIGYGKATPTTRLWVGGLGPWVPLAALAREFDRFGTIRTIDYRKGDSWAYIQYESLDAAHAAWTHMRGFPLGGPDRRLRVDFADTEHRYQQQYLQPLPLAHYDLVTDAFGHRAPDPLRGARDRTPPLLYRDRDRDRDRDLYPDSDWAPPPPPVRERERGARTAASSAVPAYEPLDSLDRRRDGWSLDRDRSDRDLPGSRDPPRKRRLADDGGGGRHLDRSPDGDRPRKRHCAPSPDRSPEPGSARDRYNSDNDRCSSRLLLERERPSPARDRRGSLEKSQGDKRDRKNSASAERDRKHRTAAPTDGKSPLKKEDRADGSASASASAASSKLKSPAQKQESGAAAASASASAAAASASPKLCLAWQGMLLLKNSNFPSNMHLLQGDLQVASSLLVEGATGGKVAQLKITQRLRLDQPKLDEVTRRIKVAGPNGYAILLAVPGSSDSRSLSSAASDTATSTQRPLRNLVSYLKQKQAAGVISLPVGGNKDKENTGVLHAFPPCEFSQQFLDSPAKALAKSEDDYLVMIIVRGFSFFTLSFKNNSSKLQTQILEQSEFGGKSPLTRKMVQL